MIAMADASTLSALTLRPRRAALLVIDIQERLAPAMPADVLARLERNVVILLEAARRFGIPVVVSEQYPKGLGRTIPSVSTSIQGLAPGAPDSFVAGPAPARPLAAGVPTVHRIEKTDFAVTDCAAFAPVAADLAAAGRDQWIVTGMETHVCVWQSVRGLLGRGAAVHVVADAVSSRTEASWRAGLGLAERAGAAITTTEAVVFDWLGRAGTDDFKALSKLIK